MTLEEFEAIPISGRVWFSVVGVRQDLVRVTKDAWVNGKASHTVSTDTLSKFVGILYPVSDLEQLASSFEDPHVSR